MNNTLMMLLLDKEHLACGGWDIVLVVILVKQSKGNEKQKWL